MARFSALGIHKVRLKVLAELSSHLDALGKNYFQVHSYCWQNPVPCDCMTEIFLLSVDDHSKLLDATRIPSRVALSIFKPAIMHSVLLTL